jgi:hypothetical protein
MWWPRRIDAKDDPKNAGRWCVGSYTDDAEWGYESQTYATREEAQRRADELNQWGFEGPRPKRARKTVYRIRNIWRSLMAVASHQVGLPN